MVNITAAVRQVKDDLPGLLGVKKGTFNFVTKVECPLFRSFSGPEWWGSD